MASFCRQCAYEMWGDENLTDLGGLSTIQNTNMGLFALTLCEGCGPNQVDHTGRCVSVDCVRQHGLVFPQPSVKDL